MKRLPVFRALFLGVLFYFLLHGFARAGGDGEWTVSVGYDGYDDSGWLYLETRGWSEYTAFYAGPDYIAYELAYAPRRVRYHRRGHRTVIYRPVRYVVAPPFFAYDPWFGWYVGDPVVVVHRPYRPRHHYAHIGWYGPRWRYYAHGWGHYKHRNKHHHRHDRWAYDYRDGRGHRGHGNHGRGYDDGHGRNDRHRPGVGNIPAPRKRDVRKRDFERRSPSGGDVRRGTIRRDDDSRRNSRVAAAPPIRRERRDPLAREIQRSDRRNDGKRRSDRPAVERREAPRQERRAVRRGNSDTGRSRVAPQRERRSAPKMDNRAVRSSRSRTASDLGKRSANSARREVARSGASAAPTRGPAMRSERRSSKRSGAVRPATRSASRSPAVRGDRRSEKRNGEVRSSKRASGRSGKAESSSRRSRRD